MRLTEYGYGDYQTWGGKDVDEETQQCWELHDDVIACLRKNGFDVVADRLEDTPLLHEAVALQIEDRF